MYVKDMFKKGFLLMFAICEYSQGNKQKYHSVHGQCHDSIKTIEYVANCPTTKDTWIEREKLKRCEEVKQTCVPMERFVYHCAVNGWRNATLEVCAPLRIIFGHCVEYSVRAKRIQYNKEKCTKYSKRCPSHYQSTDVYLYPECFETISTHKPHESDDNNRKFKGVELDDGEISVRGMDKNEHISSTNFTDRKYPILPLLLLNAITALLSSAIMSNG